MSESEQSLFRDADHLLPTNALADGENNNCLRRLGNSIAPVLAFHNVGGCTNVGPDRFRGLEPRFHLAVGARVSINNNIWTSAGLANGAKGEFVHMHWENDDRPPMLPTVVFVRVDNYHEPHYFGAESVILDNGESVNLRNVIPIAPIEAQDDRGPTPNSGMARCFRTQIPVKLVFAVSHHKSQGSTLDRVVVDIGTKEFNDGQSFTAFSRCKELNNILLEDFTLDRPSNHRHQRLFPARLGALDHMRALGDRTRVRFGLAPLVRTPRLVRPTSAGRPHQGKPPPPPRSHGGRMATRPSGTLDGRLGGRTIRGG